MKAKKQSWIVKVECIVEREVVTSDCTEAQAKENPFAHSVEERDMGLKDWEVTGVKSNE